MGRLFYNLILLTLVLYAPLWLCILCALVLAFRVRKPFYELLFFGFLLDVIHGSLSFGRLWIPLFFLSSCLVLWILGRLKKRLNIYV